MTTKQSLSDIGFTRCAVCKIDLKGRFVYLDERIESLLGYTKEELFGKSFLEFVDEKSQQLIQQLLSHRNHYETFFDSTCITVFNGSGDAFDMRTVVSLNFIAGNPVNYQLIIDCDPVYAAAGSDRELTNGHRALIEDFLNCETWNDWKDVLKLICRFTRASQACLYLIEEDSLQPRSAVTRDVTGEFEFDKIPAAEPLHLEAAKTGVEYCFTEANDVSRAVQQAGKAPNEFVTRLDMPDGTGFLVRIIFPEEFDTKKARTATNDCRALLNMATRLFNSQSSQSRPVDNTCDIKFTVGFLDSLGVAALLTDSQGNVVGYNPSTLKILDESFLEGSYLDAMKSLSEYNSPEFATPIINYLNASPLDEDFVDELTLQIKTSHSETSCLTVLKLGDDSFDLSSCFVFMPDTKAGARSALTDYSEVWQPVLARIRKHLKHTEDLAGRFGHEYYNQLGDNGNKSIAGIAEDIRQTRKMVGDLHRFTRLSTSGERPGLTDLSLVVDETLARLESDYPERKIECTHKKLPKIKTRPRLLAGAFYEILANSLDHDESPQVSVSIKAEESEGYCVVIISDSGPGIDAKDLPRVCDLLFKGSSPKSPHGGHGMGLCLARKTIELLGGKLDVSSGNDGTTVRITLPME